VLNLALEEIDLEKSGFHGPLIIGGTPVALLQLVPAAIAQLNSSGRRISISVLEGDDQQLLNKLRAGEIELMLGSMGSGSAFSDFIEEKLVEFPICAVVGAASPFRTRKIMALDQLLDTRRLPGACSVSTSKPCF
jgi:DNA-binding transcriptional LysR family regulator